MAHKDSKSPFERQLERNFGRLGDEIRARLSSEGESKQLDIGSVGGDSQVEMWDHFRRVLAGSDRLFAGTMEAINRAGYMGE